MSNAEPNAMKSCNCASSTRAAGWTAAGGIATSLGVCVACCLLPVILVALGVGGAWVSRMEALAPFK